MAPWLRRLIIAVAIACGAGDASAQSPPRPRIGLALGGGAARGMAHVGVLRWLEEHHVPIDAIAGTSMGGLIGGGYAAGMSPDEIETLLAGIDWDAMFGASGFRFEHARRKRDFRTYTSRLEFGLRSGITGPPALNGGQQVGLLLARIASAYYRTTSFDDLPTPFRCVALDLRTAQSVVFDRGPLARAMRATMAIPLTFPPVVIGDQVLVDGGTLNNLPSDVARSMGAQTVIAVNVADLGRKTHLDFTLLGLVAETMDAMIRANQAAGLAAADIAITVPLPGVSLTDWDRSRELIRAGYDAAESMKATLLPLAVSDAAWQQWQAARRARMVRTWPEPAFVRVEGADRADTARIERRLAFMRGTAFDADAIEHQLNDLGVVDRFETVSWEFAHENDADGLVLRASPKANGPPFVFLGASLQNTTSNEFRFGVGARMLAYDVLGSGTELRVDAALGSEPGAGVAWRRPLGTSRLFVEPSASARTKRLSVIADHRIAAEYGDRRISAGIDAGINPGRQTELRLGVEGGRVDDGVRLGDAMPPDLSGTFATARAQLTIDTQDDPLLPTRGVHLISTVRRLVKIAQPPMGAIDESAGATLGELSLSWARSRPDRGHRVLAFGGAGTTFNGRPSFVDQFSLGGPARLTAFGIGEARGDRYAYGGAGYLHRAFRLPDFLGRSVFVGGWTEAGSLSPAVDGNRFTIQGSVAVIADTLIGPLFAGASAGINGESRFYLGIGRIFP